MIVKSRLIALLGASLILGASAAAAALAVDRARTAPPADPACPPGACSIVLKTATGGAPSVIITPSGPAAGPAPTLATADAAGPPRLAAAFD